MDNIKSENELSGSLFDNEKTRGIETLLGDPKKAIIQLSIPMIVAMSAQTVYNLVDAIWVSGLGPDALAAIGFVFPFFFMAMAISTGIGIGGGSAVSRKIGERNKQGADAVASHTFVMTLLMAIIFTIPLIIFSDHLFVLIGAGSVAEISADYARVIFAGTILIFFTMVANSILRGEGDARRAMYIMILGAGLNIILDPIFIYTFELGVVGAAWATILSMSISAIVIFNWMFIKKDTFVSLSFKQFRFKREIVNDILKVGFPASVQQLSMSIMILIINLIIITIADNGTDGVAVYTTGWRVATLAILPLLGIATAVVSVTGAAFGEKDYKKLETGFIHGIKLGVIIEVFMAIGIFLLAPFITMLFTTAEEASRIAIDIENFLVIIVIFFPAVAFGMFSSSMFQGTGKGTNALIVTLLRTVIFTPIFALLFAHILGIGLEGIWWGIVAANVIGSLVAFVWGKMYIRSLTGRAEASV